VKVSMVHESQILTLSSMFPPSLYRRTTELIASLR